MLIQVVYQKKFKCLKILISIARLFVQYFIIIMSTFLTFICIKLLIKYINNFYGSYLILIAFHMVKKVYIYI